MFKIYEIHQKVPYFAKKLLNLSCIICQIAVKNVAILNRKSSL